MPESTETERATALDSRQEEGHQSGRREARAWSAEASGLFGGVSHLMGGVGGGGAAAGGDEAWYCVLPPLACGLSTLGRLSSANKRRQVAGCPADWRHAAPLEHEGSILAGCNREASSSVATASAQLEAADGDAPLGVAAAPVSKRNKAVDVGEGELQLRFVLAVRAVLAPGGGRAEGLLGWGSATCIV